MSSSVITHTARLLQLDGRAFLEIGEENVELKDFTLSASMTSGMTIEAMTVTGGGVTIKSDGSLTQIELNGSCNEFVASFGDTYVTDDEAPTMENELKRMYALLCDWIDKHADYMRGPNYGDNQKPCYGLIENGVAFVTKTAFNYFCEENGYNATVALCRLAENGLVGCSFNATEFISSVSLDGGLAVKCIRLKLPDAAKDDERPMKAGSRGAVRP